MTGFVFKIQANMDPEPPRPHRLHAGLLGPPETAGMKAKLVRTGKPMSLSAPQFFFAQDRAIADEAFAGDVVGIPNHGTLRIGDTLTEGEEIVFRGVPSFAPEILRRIKLTDAMKAKKLREALQQMGEEGVVQVFRPHDGSQAIVGVVGALQLDVLKERLQAEYGLPIDYEPTRFSICRWIEPPMCRNRPRFKFIGSAWLGHGERPRRGAGLHGDHRLLPPLRGRARAEGPVHRHQGLSEARRLILGAGFMRKGPRGLHRAALSIPSNQ